MKNTEISIHTKYIFQVIFCLSFRDGTLKKGLQLNGGHLDLGTVRTLEQAASYLYEHCLIFFNRKFQAHCKS